MGGIPRRDCFRSVRRERHSTEELYPRAVIALPCSILLDVLGALRPAHSSLGRDCICGHSFTPQVAFSSEGLLLVFPVDPNTDDAFYIGRIRLGSETNDVIFLWAGVSCEHLVPGTCDPDCCRVLDAADFAP